MAIKNKDKYNLKNYYIETEKVGKMYEAYFKEVDTQEVICTKKSVWDMGAINQILEWLEEDAEE